MLNQIHQEFESNQFDKMQVFQEDLKNMQQLTNQVSQNKAWKEDAALSSQHGLEKESTEDAYNTTSKSGKMTTGLQHSELTKYQSVKVSAGQRDYICYTKDQLEMAKNIKHIQSRQNQGKPVNRSAMQNGPIGVASIQSIVNRKNFSKKNTKSQGVGKRKQITMKESSTSDYKMGGISLNLNGSLP